MKTTPREVLVTGDFFSAKTPSGAALIYTDPNYGITKCRFEQIKFSPSDFFRKADRILRPGGVVAVHACMPFTTSLVNSWWKYEWVWEKSNATGHMLAKQRPLKAHETIQIFIKPGGFSTYNPQMVAGTPYNWKSRRTESEHFENRKNDEIKNSGTRYPRTVLRFQQERGLHPTQKPVALAEYLIRTYTNDEDLVVDPFLGSGTSKVACQKIGNRFFWGCEVVPKYMKIARAR